MLTCLAHVNGTVNTISPGERAGGIVPVYGEENKALPTVYQGIRISSRATYLRALRSGMAPPCRSGLEHAAQQVRPLLPAESTGVTDESPVGRSSPRWADAAGPEGSCFDAVF